MASRHSTDAIENTLLTNRGKSTWSTVMNEKAVRHLPDRRKSRRLQPQGKGTVTREEAAKYLSLVRAEFVGQPRIYPEFMVILGDFYSRRIDSREVASKISTLFEGKRELLLGFNVFLSDGDKIELPDNSTVVAREHLQGNRMSSQGQSSRSTMQEDANKFVRLVQAEFADRPQIYLQFMDFVKAFLSHRMNNQEFAQKLLTLFEGKTELLQGLNIFLPDGVKIELSARMYELATGQHLPGKQMPVQLHSSTTKAAELATDYISLVKAEFVNQPHKYDQFVAILEDFRFRRIDKEELFCIMSKLLEGKRKLLLGFNAFLPDGDKIELAEASTLVTREHLPEKRISSQAQSSRPMSAHDDASKFVLLVKEHFADRPQIYRQFVDLVKAFRSHRIDNQEFAQKLLTLFEGKTELLQGLNVFLPGFADKVDLSEASSMVASEHLPVERISVQLQSKGIVRKDATKFVQLVKAEFADQPQLYCQFIVVMKEFCTQHIDKDEFARKMTSLMEGKRELVLKLNAFLRDEDKLDFPTTSARQDVPEKMPKQLQSSNGSMEFEKAVKYMCLVKAEFADQPHIYHQFTAMMQDFCSLNIGLKEFVRKATNLFAGKRELLVGLNVYLPDGNKITLSPESNETVGHQIMEEAESMPENKPPQHKDEQRTPDFEAVATDTRRPPTQGEDMLTAPNISTEIKTVPSAPPKPQANCAAEKGNRKQHTPKKRPTEEKSLTGEKAIDTDKRCTRSVKRARRSNELIDKMLSEIRTHWLLPSSRVSDETIEQLLRGLALISMDTETGNPGEDSDDEADGECLDLVFSMKHSCGLRRYEWSILWSDFSEPTPGVMGRIRCEPFCEDPPFRSRLNQIKKGFTSESGSLRPVSEFKAELETFNDQYHDEMVTLRSSWNLKRIPDLKDECIAWRKACSLKPHSIRVADVARCVCAGIGVLARNHRNNRSEWVLKRLMLLLEAELRVWGRPGDDIDPKELELLEKCRQHGGSRVGGERWDN